MYLATCSLAKIVIIQKAVVFRSYAARYYLHFISLLVLWLLTLLRTTSLRFWCFADMDFGSRHRIILGVDYGTTYSGIHIYFSLLTYRSDFRLGDGLTYTIHRS